MLDWEMHALIPTTNANSHCQFFCCKNTRGIATLWSMSARSCSRNSGTIPSKQSTTQRLWPKTELPFFFHGTNARTPFNNDSVADNHCRHCRRLRKFKHNNDDSHHHHDEEGTHLCSSFIGRAIPAFGGWCEQQLAQGQWNVRTSHDASDTGPSRLFLRSRSERVSCNCRLERPFLDSMSHGQQTKASQRFCMTQQIALHCIIQWDC